MDIKIKIEDLVKPYLKGDKNYFRVGVWHGNLQDSQMAIIGINPKNPITTDHCTPEEFGTALADRDLFEECYRRAHGHSRTRDNYDFFREAVGYRNVVESNISAYPSDFKPNDANHIEGKRRARQFLQLLQPKLLLIGYGTPWKEMMDSGLIRFGIRSSLKPDSTIPVPFNPKWGEIEIYAGSSFQNRPCDIMCIPQGSGRWRRGVFMLDHPHLFRYLGHYVKRQYEFRD